MPDELKPPFVGRNAQLEKMLGYLGDTLSSKGALVLVSGEAGIGKTRLCEEFERLAASAGAQAFTGRCVPGAASPLLPFQEAFIKIGSRISKDLRADGMNVPLTRGPHVLDVESSLSDEGRMMADPRSENERMMFSVLEFLKGLSDIFPVVLIVEDLHWADSTSIMLMHFLARNIGDLKVMIVGTYRPEDLALEDERERHPLVDSLRIMRREKVCEEITLDLLLIKDIESAIRGMFRERVDREIVGRIAAESGGNPLFAIEMVRDLVLSHNLRKESGVWRSRNLDEIDVPVTVVEVIMRRIDRLTQDQRHILDCAAVIGDSFQPDMIQEVLSTSRLKVLEALDTLDEIFQLIKLVEGDYYFCHEKIQRVTYDQISSVRRSELHRLIGEALEKKLPNPEILGRLALHFEYGGDKAKCLQYSVQAGERCLSQFALAEAIPFFEKVLNRTGDRSHPELRLRALEGLGSAHLDLCNYNSSITPFEEFLAHSDEPKCRARVLRKCAECWAPTRLGKGEYQSAFRYLDDAEAQGDIDPYDKAEIMSYRYLLHLWKGETDKAEEFCVKAENIFMEIEAWERLAIQYTYHLVFDITNAKIDDALEKGERIRNIYSQITSPSGEMELENYLGIAYLHRGLLKESFQALNRSLDIAERMGDNVALIWGHIYRGYLFEVMDDLDSSILEGMRTLEYAKETESDYMLTGAYAYLVHAHCMAGNATKAQEYMIKMEEMDRSFDWSIKTPVSGMVAISSAEYYSALKQWDQSNQFFMNGLELLEGASFGTWQRAMAHARYGLSLKQQGEIEQAGEELAISEQIFDSLGNTAQVEWVRNNPP